MPPAAQRSRRHKPGKRDRSQNGGGVAGAKSGQEIIAEVGATITSNLVLEDVLSSVARQIGEAFGSFSCDIHYYSEADDQLTFVANWECDDQVPPDILSHLLHSFSPIEWPSLARVVRDREIVEVHIDDTDLPELEREQMQHWGEKTTLDAPLIFAGEVIGVLGLAETRLRRFTAAERRLFEQLAVLAAIAIHNAMTVRRLEEQNRYLVSLLEASHALAEGTVGGALALMARKTAEALHSPVCIVYEYDQPADQLITRAAYASSPKYKADDVGGVYPLEKCPDDRSVIERNEPVVRTVSDLDLALPARESLAEMGARTLLKIPLAANGVVVGLMFLLEVDVERRFMKGELELAYAIGHQIAATLRNGGARGRA
jgi:GAF domain-containing protein